MTRSNRILIGAGGAALVLLIAFYFASPILALHSLTAAAKAGDRVKLEQKVDFPAVRESLKAQLKATMTRKFEEDPKLRDNPFAAFGQILLTGVVDKAVDSFATPDAIANMVATNKPPKNVSPTPGGPVIEQPQPEVAPEAAQPGMAQPEIAQPEIAQPEIAQPEVNQTKSDVEVKYGYQDLDHFRATYRDRAEKTQEPFGLVLKRHGLFGWKLVRIELPGLENN